MAIGATLTKVSVRDAGEQFAGKQLYLECELKLWHDDAMPGEADLTQTVTGKYSAASGVSLVDRLTFTKDEIVAKCQVIIDKFIREKVLLDKTEVDSVVSTAASELNLGV